MYIFLCENLKETSLHQETSSNLHWILYFIVDYKTETASYGGCSTMRTSGFREDQAAIETITRFTMIEYVSILAPS